MDIYGSPAAQVVTTTVNTIDGSSGAAEPGTFRFVEKLTIRIFCFAFVVRAFI